MSQRGIRNAHEGVGGIYLYLSARGARAGKNRSGVFLPNRKGGLGYIIELKQETKRGGKAS